MSYIVSTDACCDVSEDFLREKEIPVVPMPYLLKMPVGEVKGMLGKAKEYTEEQQSTDTSGFLDNMKAFFDVLRAGAIPKTSQANAETVASVLEPFVKAGKDVLHIAFSSGMSGSYNSAVIAAKELMEKYKGRKVLVVDSLGGVGGQGLCVMDACKLRDEGKSIEEVQKILSDYAPCYHHYFTVGNNAYIARSGRISSFEYMFASLLNVTIILGLDGEGKVYPAAKVRGTKNVYKKFLELFETQKGDADVSNIILSHGDNPEGIKTLEDLLREANPEVSQIDTTYVNQMVGCNSGPGAIALFFRGKPREVYSK